MFPIIARLTAGGETAALVGKGPINRGTPSIARRKADAIALKARIAISAVNHLVMFAPALGFLVAEPTPHLIPGAIKKTTVLIIIIRSEERREGQECVSTCRSRWPQYPIKQNQPQNVA